MLSIYILMREGLQGFFLKIALLVLKLCVSITLRMDGGHAIMIPEPRLASTSWCLGGLGQGTSRCSLQAMSPLLIFGLLRATLLLQDAMQSPAASRLPTAASDTSDPGSHAARPSDLRIDEAQAKCSRPALCSVLLY